QQAALVGRLQQSRGGRRLELRPGCRADAAQDAGAVAEDVPGGIAEGSGVAPESRRHEPLRPRIERTKTTMRVRTDFTPATMPAIAAISPWISRLPVTGSR